MKYRKEIESKMKMTLPIIQGLLASGKYIEKYDDNIYRLEKEELVADTIEILEKLESEAELAVRFEMEDE